MSAPYCRKCGAQEDERFDCCEVYEDQRDPRAALERKGVNPDKTPVDVFMKEGFGYFLTEED